MGGPAGFPKVVHCQVVVTDGGSPLEGVTVGLLPDNPTGSLVLSGKTDALGIATVRSMLGSYSKDGAPEGSYTVTLSKVASVDLPTVSSQEEYDRLTPEQRANMEKEQLKAIEAARIVPEHLGNSQSPLKLQVDSSGGRLEVDIKDYKK